MNLTNVSRFISLILRHKPETINIKLDKNGWANVQELIQGIQKQYSDFNFDTLKYIVDTDDKQRYSFSEDFSKIRANQGHSIPVDVELKECEPPEFLFHGTGVKYTSSIDQQGLISKSRLYVHLSEDITTAINVGQRHGVPIVYMVDAKRMFKDGYKFYLSNNNVWLTKEVPIKYLSK